MRLFACTLFVAFVATAANATPTKHNAADHIRHPGQQLAGGNRQITCQGFLTSKSARRTASERTNHTLSQSEAVGPSPLVQPLGKVLFLGSVASVSVERAPELTTDRARHPSHQSGRRTAAAA
jgi:hypothetical protein